MKFYKKFFAPPELSNGCKPKNGGARADEKKHEKEKQPNLSFKKGINLAARLE